MLKILLVYDDFQELATVELMLKKIGFDVVGVASEFSLAEQLLSFNPEIVVAQGRTAKVSTASVGRRLRESVRWDGQSILVFYPNAKPQPTELLKIRMDVGLEYPVEPTKMVHVLAQLGSLDANQLLDKLIKSMAQETGAESPNKESSNYTAKSEKESVFVSGGVQPPDPNKKATGQERGQNPLFPLQGKNQEAEKKSAVDAAGNSSDISLFGLTDTFGSNSFKIDSLTQDPMMQELENLLKKKTDLSIMPPLRDPTRHKHYDEYMRTIPIQQLASIKRKDAKLRLKDLIKDIDKQGLEDQDVLRREYVKALFKKEG